MKKITTLMSAVRGQQYATAQDIFSGIMQEKVERALSVVRKTISEDSEECEHGYAQGCKACSPDGPMNEGDDKCVLCGSRKNLEVVDGSAICDECDPER